MFVAVKLNLNGIFFFLSLLFLQISECKCICKEAAFIIFNFGFGVFSTREPESSVGVLTLGEF